MCIPLGIPIAVGNTLPTCNHSPSPSPSGRSRSNDNNIRRRSRGVGGRVVGRGCGSGARAVLPAPPNQEDPGVGCCGGPFQPPLSGLADQGSGN